MNLYTSGPPVSNYPTPLYRLDENRNTATVENRQESYSFSNPQWQAPVSGSGVQINPTTSYFKPLESPKNHTFTYTSNTVAPQIATNAN